MGKEDNRIQDHEIRLRELEKTSHQWTGSMTVGMKIGGAIIALLQLVIIGVGVRLYGKVDDHGERLTKIESDVAHISDEQKILIPKIIEKLSAKPVNTAKQAETKFGTIASLLSASYQSGNPVKVESLKPIAEHVNAALAQFSDVPSVWSAGSQLVNVASENTATAHLRALVASGQLADCFDREPAGQPTISAIHGNTLTVTGATYRNCHWSMEEAMSDRGQRILSQWFSLVKCEGCYVTYDGGPLPPPIAPFRYDFKDCLFNIETQDVPAEPIRDILRAKLNTLTDSGTV